MTSSDRNRWIGLACLALGLAMIIVDTSIVNVAVPRIITDLGITPSAAEWVNSSYALVFAAALITLSRIGDIIGQRRLYLVGTAVFASASVLAALAPLGDDYVRVVDRSFKERWIDLLPNEGKRSGAYSEGAVYDAHPYMLLNYLGKYDDVSTLAQPAAITSSSASAALGASSNTL